MLRRLLRSAMTTQAVAKMPIPRRGVDYRGKVVLAPMVRSGELPSRLLALHYGADLVWGPETVDKALIGCTRKVDESTNTILWSRPGPHGSGNQDDSSSSSRTKPEQVVYRIHPELEGKKLVFQLGTANAELAVQAARMIAGDVAGIDVNAGCPKPFSTSGGMGAALLRTPDRLCGILEALVRDVGREHEIGISVKIRLLETAAETEALVRRLVATGITGLTVHCRTTPMRPRERAIRGQLPMVADVCRAAGVACLMNGDVESRDHAALLVPEYGVDGAMIAIAAERNPSCFRSSSATAADHGGLAPWEELVARYLAYALDVENRFGNSKFCLAHLLPGKRPEMQLVSRAKSYTALCDALGLTHLAARARELDVSNGLDPEALVQGNQKKKNNNKKGKANSAAMAAGGLMAEARAADHHARKKSLSERGVNVMPDLAAPQNPAAEAAVAM